MNFDTERLASYIREKIKTTDPYFEDVYWISDSQIEKMMTTTMEVVEEKFSHCFYCQNFRRFGFSKCRIRNHIRNDCFYYTPNVNRILEKSEFDIILKSRIRFNFETKNVIPPDVTKKIIYESIKLLDLIKTLEVIK